MFPCLPGGMTDRIGAIVDGYSTGRYLAREFRDLGVACVHVQSSAGLPRRLLHDFDPTEFQGIRSYHSDAAATTRWLASRDVRFVVAGAESGVELADALSQELGLPTNGAQWSSARRNKAAMAAALRRHGMRTAAGCVVTNPADAVAWATDWGRYPVVVKPVASSGTEDVRFCRAADAVWAAVAAVLGKVNRLGMVNHQALVQEYLHGDQYVVNTLTVAGEHYVAEIWADRRRPVPGAANIYDFEELLPRAGAVQDRLASCAEAVLDSLHVSWGPGHLEIIDTASGPVLVEAATRMAGVILPDIVAKATGHSHVALTARCYANPELVAMLPGTPYQKFTELVTVSLIAHQSGIVRGMPGLRGIQELRSCSGILMCLAPGDTVRPTVDLATSPGIVYLTHADRDQIFRDYHTIREWEKSGALYDVDRTEGTS